MKALTGIAVGVLTAAALTVAALPANAKDWKTVVIGTEGGYAPWNLTAADGSLDGFEVELVKDLCARMKVECKLITHDWDSMIPSLNAGKFDVIMDALSISDERKQVIGFTDPYAATPASFAVLKDSELAKQLPMNGEEVKLTGDATHDKDVVEKLRPLLKGKAIGIQAATIYSKFIYDNFKDIADIREYKTAAEHDLDVVTGRIDAAFDDATYFLSAFESPENKDLTLAGPKIGGPIWGEGEAFGLRKSDTDLKAMFDVAIAAALADGTVKKLSLKWFKVDVSP